MNQFNPKLYESLFGQWADPVITSHEKDEVKMIQSACKNKEIDVVDLGAGYGRIAPFISPFVKRLYCVEIDIDMFQNLVQVTKSYRNTKCIKGDITKLSNLFKKISLSNPLIIILQNTLGTIEGNWRDVLIEMRRVAQDYKGEMIISLYRQQALKDWGIMTYTHGAEMNGEPDMKKTNFEKGLFISKTDYISKWWTDKEIQEIKKILGGTSVSEIVTFEYIIFHIKY